MKNTYFNLTEQSFKFPQKGFDLKKGFLTFHKVSLEHLIRKYGTPFRLFYLPDIGEKNKTSKKIIFKSLSKT
jgi:arginine decarboxylase